MPMDNDDFINVTVKVSGAYLAMNERSRLHMWEGYVHGLAGSDDLCPRGIGAWGVSYRQGVKFAKNMKKQLRA